MVRNNVLPSALESILTTTLLPSLSLLLSSLIKIQCALKAQFKQHLCLKLSLILQVKINRSFLLLLHCSGLSIIKLDFYFNCSKLFTYLFPRWTESSSKVGPPSCFISAFPSRPLPRSPLSDSWALSLERLSPRNVCVLKASQAILLCRQECSLLLWSPTFSLAHGDSEGIFF